MTTFRYKAYSARGEIKAGTIVAAGLDAAIDALYHSGLTPFETCALADGAAERSGRTSATAAADADTSIWKREFLPSNRFSLKELTAFTTELSSLTNSGLKLDVALRIIAGQGASPKAARLANQILTDVLAGLQLSEAMAHRPEVFPSDYRAILAAGEAGGRIGPVLKQISELLIRRLEIRNKITSALIYPIILILMSLLSIVVILFVLIPNISPIFVDAGLPLPGILYVFEAAQNDWLTVLLTTGFCGVAALLLAGKVKRNPAIMQSVDRLTCSIPVIGQLIQNRDAGRFARALGTLLAAGVPMMSAMQTGRALVNNRHLNVLYEGAIKRIPEGTPLHRAFGSDNLLPPPSLRLIAVGEETGQLGPMLIQVAAAIEADLQRRIERMVGLLTPVLTLVIGGGIGGLIMQVMTAILSINNLAFQ